MRKLITFDGPTGPAFFYLLYALYKTGTELNKTRTSDDVLTEAAIDDAIDGIAARDFAEAQAAGMVPAQVLADVERANELRRQATPALPPIDEPLVLKGLPAKFLGTTPTPTLRLDPAREWRVMREAIHRAVPHTHPRDVQLVRDLLRFVEAAPTADETAR